ncbi:MAG: molybdopterin biosynthesis protein MoeB [Phenylobacterium zucineum]|nr:MAG: molybdopterin biosynthesis protein MoeB [Phenylobacterium zucineum]
MTGRLGPIVEPGAELSASDAERFARHLPIPGLGETAQRRLRAARVCVVGAGGLGSPALLYLAAAGVGTLGVVDADLVELANLQRQVLHTTAGIGTPKAASAAARLAELDPGLRVVEHPVRLDAGNATEILSGYDLVIDAVDNYPTRYLISDTCADVGLPVVWGAVRVTRAQVSVFWSRPYGPDGPLPGITLRDLYPDPPDPSSWVTAAQVGVLGAMCGQVGALMASEAIKLITGAGQPLFGRLLYLDTMAASVAEVPLSPRRTP